MKEERRQRAGQILQRIVAACEPLLFAPPWDFLTARDDCFGRIADPNALLADLRTKFGEKFLWEIGVIARDENGQTRLRDEVTTSSAIIALRAAPDDLPYDLLVAGGSLERGAVPILSMRRDAWTRQALLKCRRLQVTSSILEVCILRACGLVMCLLQENDEKQDEDHRQRRHEVRQCACESVRAA